MAKKTSKNVNIATKPKEKKKKSSVKKDEKNSIPKEPIIKEVIAVGEDLEDELDENISGAEEELAKMEKKWWLEEPWRSLLDPELGKNVDFARFDISKLIEDFTAKMLKEELIDFRISGMAIYSSAKFYHQKITSVIKEEEQIEKKKVQERIKREVPKAISQPLREARKLATSDELFGAMRRAIIETMQKREKLRIRRERTLAKRETKVIKKSKGKLPAEILKHITGKEDTIEERLQKWHQKLKTMRSLSDKPISMDDIKKMIYEDQEKHLLEKKIEYISTFEAMLFLASLNKIVMRQETMRSPIKIRLTDQKMVDLK